MKTQTNSKNIANYWKTFHHIHRIHYFRFFSMTFASPFFPAVPSLYLIAKTAFHMAVPAKCKNSLLPLGFFLFDSRESSLLEYELAKPSQPTTRNHILNFSNARLSVDSVVSVTDCAVVHTGLLCVDPIIRFQNTSRRTLESSQ